MGRSFQRHPGALNPDYTGLDSLTCSSIWAPRGWTKAILSDVSPANDGNRNCMTIAASEQSIEERRFFSLTSSSFRFLKNGLKTGSVSVFHEPITRRAIGQPPGIAKEMVPGVGIEPTRLLRVPGL